MYRIRHDPVCPFSEERYLSGRNGAEGLHDYDSALYNDTSRREGRKLVERQCGIDLMPVQSR